MKGRSYFCPSLFGQYATIELTKQRINKTLYSEPFLPWPTTNQPSGPWTRIIPTINSIQKTIERILVHRLMIISSAASNSNAVIRKALYGGNPKDDKYSSNPDTPPVTVLEIPWISMLPAAATRIMVSAWSFGRIFMEQVCAFLNYFSSP